MSDEDQGVETARIEITRTVHDDDVIDHVLAIDGSGDELPLAESLGMLALAQHTLATAMLIRPEEDQ